MLFMEKDENGFQNFSIRILESTESLRQVVLDEFENFIFNSNIMSGVNKIDEPTLLSLICESHKSEYIREFIVEMLPLLEQSCITDRVFDSCISYSDTEFRKTLCILLAHMWLRIDLLLTLNEELDTPEAFIKAVCIMVRERYSKDEFEVSRTIMHTAFMNASGVCIMVRERYSKDEFEVFLRRNKHFWNALPCCISWLMPKYEDSTLVDVIKNYANQAVM